MVHSIVLWLAIVFGFTMACGIGANDVSNAMGTSVGSKAITIRQAIIIASIFEFLGALFVGSEVTTTIRENLINPNLFDVEKDYFILGMLSSLLAAGTWLLAASFFGWPVSTTHTIVGGIVGFGCIVLGVHNVQWVNVFPIIISWCLSPFLGAIIAFCLFMSAQHLIFSHKHPLNAAKKIIPVYILLTSWIIFMIICSKLYHLGIKLTLLQTFYSASVLSIISTLIGKIIINNLHFKTNDDRQFDFTNVEKIFSILMVFTACIMAFAHGSNDVANAIGPVAAVVCTTQNINPGNSPIVPTWVLFIGATGIVIGLALYGHKVIETVGSKITHLTPSRGFSATLASATTVVFASSTGLPISTTHTLVGGILGVGLARGIHALNLNVIKTIFISWLITLPAGAFLSIIFFYMLKFFLLN